MTQSRRAALVTGTGPGSLGEATADALHGSGFRVLSTPGPVRCRTTGTRSSSRRGSLETAPLLARLRKLAAPLERRTFVSPAEGARTTVFCATSPEAVPGGYHRRSAAAESSDDVRDASVAARLWDATSAWAESV